MPAPVIVVHGGAGAWRASDRRIDDAIEACRQAARAGYDILAAGGAALDAVEAAVRILEDAPVLNAGRGAYPNRAGQIELDAMIMDGRTLAIGAVAAVQRIGNPVSLARQVMERSGHNLLVAAGAEAFADEIGFPRCSLDYLVGPRAAAPGDTVGAVALDRDGNLAAASSTGGIPDKRPGRVGDSPLVGCGAYADNATAAVTATGDGEALMRIVISKRVSDAVGRGIHPQEACGDAILELERRTSGRGGLIAVGRSGQIGIAINTEAMPWAVATPAAVRSGHAAGDT